MTSQKTTSPSAESRCSKCGDSGWEFYTDAEGVKRTRKCSCGLIDRSIMDRQKAYAEIPDAFKDYRLDSFKTTIYKDKAIIAEASKTIRYWFQNLDKMMDEGIGLYISSSTKGSGKTRMVASIANELMIESGYPVKFATSIQILTEIRSTWDKASGTSESRLLNQLTSIKVLVLDDFGTETVKDWIGERFYHIINERYVRNLPTIYTSNKRLDKLDYDDRITNRILEKTIQVVFPEESVRTMIALQREQEMLKARND